jgi:hypothetical protein
MRYGTKMSHIRTFSCHSRPSEAREKEPSQRACALKDSFALADASALGFRLRGNDTI